MSTLANTLCNYELERQKNIEKNKQMLLELGIMDSFDMRDAQPLVPMDQKARKSPLKRELSDFEIRRSDRILGKIPRYNTGEDDDEYEPEDVEVEEDEDDRFLDGDPELRVVVRKVRARLSQSGRRSRGDGERPTWKPFYGSEISTCHMCYIRNRKPKTKCSQCYSHFWRGHICRDCYDAHFDPGEAAAAAAIAAGQTPVERFEEAVKNPNWICFVCRGTCPCAYCRAGLTKRGKRHFRKESDSTTPLLLEDNYDRSTLMMYDPSQQGAGSPNGGMGGELDMSGTGIAGNGNPLMMSGDRPKKKRGRPPKSRLSMAPVMTSTDPADAYQQQMQQMGLMGHSPALMGGHPSAFTGQAGGPPVHLYGASFGNPLGLASLSGMDGHGGVQGPGMSALLLNPLEDLLGLDHFEPIENQQGVIQHTIKLEANQYPHPDMTPSWNPRVGCVSPTSNGSITIASSASPMFYSPMPSSSLSSMHSSAQGPAHKKQKLIIRLPGGGSIAPTTHTSAAPATAASAPAPIPMHDASGFFSLSSQLPVFSSIASPRITNHHPLSASAPMQRSSAFSVPKQRARARPLGLAPDLDGPGASLMTSSSDAVLALMPDTTQGTWQDFAIRYSQPDQMEQLEHIKCEPTDLEGSCELGDDDCLYPSSSSSREEYFLSGGEDDESLVLLASQTVEPTHPDLLNYEIAKPKKNVTKRAPTTKPKKDPLSLSGSKKPKIPAPQNKKPRTSRSKSPEKEENIYEKTYKQRSGNKRAGREDQLLLSTPIEPEPTLSQSGRDIEEDLVLENQIAETGGGSESNLCEAEEEHNSRMQKLGASGERPFMTDFSMFD